VIYHGLLIDTVTVLSVGVEKSKRDLKI
jgi:hypothetical protein